VQRETKQRDAIRLVFDENESPLLPNEVLKLAQKTVPTLSLATVYRTLNAFVQEGMLRLVSLPAEAPRFERAGKHHHHHFVCRNCKKVFEVHACAGSMQKMVPAGFEMDDHEITLYGLCADCSKQSKN
jgi:Fur family ferric uptake transcriptional regulator